MDDPELQKRLRDTKTDITDYFNYGFSDKSWRLYCEKVVQLASKTEKFIHDEGTSKFLLDRIPIEFGGFGSPHFDTVKELAFFSMIKRHRERFFLQFKRSDDRFGQHAYLALQEQMRNALCHDQIVDTYTELKACYNQVAPDLLNMKQPLPMANPHLRHRQMGGFARPYSGGINFARPMGGGGQPFASADDQNSVSTAATIASGYDRTSHHASSATSVAATNQSNFAFSRVNIDSSGTLPRAAPPVRSYTGDNSGNKSQTSKQSNRHDRSESASKSSHRSHESKDKTKKKRERSSRDGDSGRDKRDSVKDKRDSGRDKRDSTRDQREPSRERKADRQARRSRSRSKSGDKHESRTSKKYSDKEERRHKEGRSSRDRKEKKDKEHRERHKPSGKESSRRRERSSESKPSRGSSDRGKRSGEHRSSRRVEKPSIHERIQIRK